MTQPHGIGPAEVIRRIHLHRTAAVTTQSDKIHEIAQLVRLLDIKEPSRDEILEKLNKLSPTANEFQGVFNLSRLMNVLESQFDSLNAGVDAQLNVLRVLNSLETDANERAVVATMKAREQAYMDKLTTKTDQLCRVLRTIEEMANPDTRKIHESDK